MKQTRIKKLIVVLIVFVIMFSNFGHTISALASTSGFEAIRKGFFGTEEIEFKAYFEENGEQLNEKISDVNQTIQLKLEVLPKQEGYLSNAIIKAVTESGDMPNFKIKNIQTYTTNADEVQDSSSDDVTSLEDDEEEDVSTQSQEISILTNGKEEKYQTSIEVVNEEEIISDEETSVDIIEEAPIEESTSIDITEEVPTEENTSMDIVEEDVFIDEDKVIEEKVEEKSNEETFGFLSDVQILSENEISINNVIEDTVYIVELEYVQTEDLKEEDLYKKITLQFSGIFVNSDLESVGVSKEEKIAVGWEYNKDIELYSEYTKFSPYKIGEKTGTIAENKIIVKREVTEAKYLPIKMTILEINVPTFNGKLPVEVSVLASKLLATKGEDIGNVTFSNEDWTYDKEIGKITIVVENEKEGQVQNTSGEDEYTIIYRFEDYTEEVAVELNKEIKLTVEQYNGKENQIIQKEIQDSQHIDVSEGELVTYTIHSSEEKIEKSKMYANYNSEETLYETEYTSYVTLDILTSDMLETIKIDCSKEIYKDIDGFEYPAEGIIYKNIKFNYGEIKPLLENGGNIEIYNLNGELLWIFDNASVQNEESCSIYVNIANGIIVQINNVTINGTINFEITKTISKCNYEKSALKNFTQIESRITAGVKYANVDEMLTLQEVGTTKDLKESYTRANIYISNEDLTTIHENENVELRVELNNDKQDSDLYVNPSFELVFPKYVKEVLVEDINLLYDSGLVISDFYTYTESDIVKMRIELAGVQTTFSDNVLTNGTNIVVNVRIKVDEYTPTKEDYIKMYYYNEGVSNYESQTGWTINKMVPDGILKATNGFDVASIQYNAPSGLVAINGIINYDGNLSEIKSVKEGEKSVQIPIAVESRIATMELLALNNTENECTDMVMIGRIPFKGNKDVITNEDLGTTTTTPMKDFIKADTQNTNTETIYYSTNENASKDLEDTENNWVLAEEVADISAIRSYMIVIDGNVSPSSVLRYTYEFEIPENLPYEVSIAGSFGIYYNNHSDVGIVYESSSADKVSLKTEVGAQIQATLSVDIGDGAQIKSMKRMQYTVKIVNSGSVAVNDVSIQAPIPEHTTYVEKKDRGYEGDYGFEEDNSKKTIEFNIPVLNSGEVQEFSYYVITGRKPLIEGVSDGEDENGYFYYENDEKIYITEVPPIYITNKIIVTSISLANPIETNEIQNELIYGDFYSQIKIDHDREIQEGFETNFTLNLVNIANKTLENVVAVFHVGNIYQYEEGSINGENGDITFNEDEGKIYFNIGNMEAEDIIVLKTKVIAKQINSIEETEECYFEIMADNSEIDKSTVIKQTVIRALVEARDITVLAPTQVNENEEIVISTQITNIGGINCKNAYLEARIPEALNITTVSCNNQTLVYKRDSENTEISLPLIKSNQSVSVDIVLKSKNLSGNENTNIILERNVLYEEQNIAIQSIEFMIINNEKTTEEIEQERVDQLNKEYEERMEKYKEEQQRYEEEQEENESNLIEVQPNPEEDDSVQENKQQNSEPQVDNSQSTEQKNTYTISGLAWLDENKNGIREDGEKLLNGIKVYLLKNNNMIRSTITDTNGKYIFDSVEEGRYVVAFSYDDELYSITTYKKKNVEQSRNSDAIESKSDNILAITNEFSITGVNIENIDIGLQSKDKFDLAIHKYISAIKLTTKKETKVYEYENLDIAKVEISAKQLEGAQVELEYTIQIENIGEIEGYVGEIVDLLPNDVEFTAEKNSEWYKGTDGYVYLKNIKNTLLKPGDMKEVKLILTKTMTEENTGVVSNKIELKNAQSETQKDLITENNTSVQNTFILVSTGMTKQIIGVAIAILMLAILICIGRNKIHVMNINNFTEKIKKRYR